MLKAVIQSPKALNIPEPPPSLPQKPLFSNLKVDRLSAMESELKALLANDSISGDKKYALYNSVLTEALNLYNGAVKKPSANISLPSRPPAASTPAPTKRVTVHNVTFPKKGKNRKKILKPLKKAVKIKKVRIVSLDDRYPSK